jgi:hypothetical protein
MDKVINSVGLVFDMIGAGFVAWEVIKQYKGKKYSNRDNISGWYLCRSFTERHC